MAGNMGKMMKQLQKVQEQMVKLQKELAEKEVEATSGGGAVKAIANGKKQLLSLKIAPEVVDPEDVEMLEDLILAAVNEVMDRVDEVSADEMQKITGGLNLPPGLI